MLDLLIVAALAGSIPITDEAVDAVCQETFRLDCSLAITPASSGASFSAPGFDVYISDVVWEDDGIEPGTGAYSGVAFDREIVVTDPGVIPNVGMFGLSVACATPEGEFVRFTEDDWDDVSLEFWSQAGAPTSPASIESIAANTSSYGYAEITDLCDASERRAIVGFGLWADEVSALSPTFESGWVDGDNRIRPFYNQREPMFAVVGTSLDYGEPFPISVTVEVSNVNSTGSRQQFCDSLLSAQFQVYVLDGGGTSKSTNVGSCAAYWPIDGNFSSTATFIVEGSDSSQMVDYARLHFTAAGVVVDETIYYPPGHLSYVEGGEVVGWSATLAMSDALDDVVFIPGDDESGLRELPGMCVDWNDCLTYCDEAQSWDIPEYLHCVFVPPFVFTEVVDALSQDLIQGPIVAYSRVLLSNAQRVMSAVAGAGEQCGPIGSFDLGSVGQLDINTCDVPSGWRSLVRIVFSALISVASLMLVARLMLSAVGLQGVLDFGRHNGVDS